MLSRRVCFNINFALFQSTSPWCCWFLLRCFTIWPFALEFRWNHFFNRGKEIAVASKAWVTICCFLSIIINDDWRVFKKCTFEYFPAVIGGTRSVEATVDGRLLVSLVAGVNRNFHPPPHCSRGYRLIKTDNKLLESGNGTM